VIDRIGAAVAAALFLVLMSGCTDGIPAQTEVPATTEPIDLASLKGKIIRVNTFTDNSPQLKDDIHLIGTTIVWNGPWYETRCVLNGLPARGAFGDRMAILFTPGQPKSDVKIPCEGTKDHSGSYWTETDPAVVVYSSTMTLQGNVLELTGELGEQNRTVFGGGPLDGTPFNVTMDIREHLHARFRLSADKCQILDFSRSREIVEIHSEVGRSMGKWSERGIGCSIVAAPS